MCSPRTLSDQCAVLLVPCPSRAHRRLYVGIWESILAVAAAFRTLPSWGSPMGNKRQLELQKLALWVVRTGARSGIGFTIGFLKGAAADARLRAITGSKVSDRLRFLLRRMPGMSSKEGLEQLAYLGRSLPEGDELVASRNLVAHRRHLTTPHTTAPRILAFAHQFAERFALRHLGAWEIALPCSPSATLTTSRRSGGCREQARRERPIWLSSLKGEERTSSDAHDFPAYGGFLSDEEVELTRYNTGFRDLATAAARLTAAGQLSHRVCTIPERGWKRRIVSAPPGYASVAGGVLNRALLRGLSREPRCRRFLAGDRRLAVEEAMTHHRSGDVIVSTDLTAASDLLPLDLVEAVVRGLIAGWMDIPDVWAEALLSLTGPQTLRYPWGGEANSTRGILMGLGPTWPVLSLIHLIWVDLAALRAGQHCREPGWVATAIGGDDLIGSWPPELSASYQRIVRYCGGRFSSGKAFFSEVAGNFTEMTFWVTPAKLRPSGAPIRWAQGIPVKGLVSLSLDLEGEAFESVGSDGGRPERARRVLLAVRPDVWRRCRESGVVPVMPRSLGGAGLPPRRGCVQKVLGPLWLRLALGRFLYGSGSDQVPLGPPSWVSSRDRVALTARSRSEAVLAREVEFGIITFVKDPDSTPEDRNVSDWLQNETSLFSQAAIFSDRPLPASNTGIADASRFARLVRRWSKKRLLGGVPNALAIKNGRNNRSVLLARARLNRQRWRIRLLVDPEFYYGSSI